LADLHGTSLFRIENSIFTESRRADSSFDLGTSSHRENLNEIRNALDCQIGNMISLISVPEDDAINADNVARDAALFDLYILFSLGVGSESGEQLGSLRMYCCV
jgi:hypothetical protein